MRQTGRESGFTLIEMSIVLVIIGLIVGGILVGQDMMKAAEARAQIAQIEKYDSAVNTFKSKFGEIPGDMSVSTANQFGFTVGTGCNGTTGRRDGNGLLDGQAAGFLLVQAIGETGLFWQDISSAVAGNLIEGSFPNGGAPTIGCLALTSLLSSTTGSTYVGDYFPAAKIGHGNFVYVYDASGFNWYGVAGITGTFGAYDASLSIQPTIPVIEAYNIDRKIDDGLPTTGSVNVVFPLNAAALETASPAASDTTTSCYNSTSNTYSISSAANFGAGGNCALSFRFK